MKKYIILCLLILLVQSISAQRIVEGVVTDVGGHPVSAAIIKTIDATTKKTLHFCQTDTKGKFTITAQEGNILSISAISYKKQELKVTMDMPAQHITLEEDTKTLSEITVKAKPIKIKGDTIQYLLTTYKKAGDRTLADVLARVPGFDVNKENGEIQYEGKSISNFYIEGMNLMGGKYGLATKSLPQDDVATVEVMKHHQPIRVLDDFTYTDDNAINIRMKQGAKARWMTSYSGGIGLKSHGGLWNFETFAMRLKPNFQTILTYKTNNIGKNIRREADKLLSFDELQSPLSAMLSLPSPSPLLLKGRSLFNRSHVVSLNALQRIDENSQVNVQITFVNDRNEATSLRHSDFYTNSGIRTIENRKQYLEKSNDLFAKIKYENNAKNHYLKNELSGDFSWNKQWLNEQGTQPHKMMGNLPIYTLKDNFSIMKKYGKHLITLQSKNIMDVRPQQLYVDSLAQSINQHYYETNTDVSGSLRIGRFILSGQVGVNAGEHRFTSDLVGVPDSIGLLMGKSSFTFASFYTNPSIEYTVKDFNFTLSGDMSYNHYKYSLDNGQSKVLFSPNFHIRWNATATWTFSADASINTMQINAAQFYPTLVLQDYQYMNKGLAGYNLNKEKSVGIGVVYSDALKGTSIRLRITKSFGNSPYTSTQDYVGNYIVESLTPEETKYNSWNMFLMGSQGIGFLKGKLNVKALYNAMNSYLVQNSQRMPYDTKNLKITSNLDIGLIKGVDLTYKLTYDFHQMKMPAFGKTSNLNSWKHEGSLRIPLCKVLSLETLTEYYHNEIAQKKFKDMFFQDFTLIFKAKHFDLSLAWNNVFNNKSYSYGLNNTLSSSFSNQDIRGRELMLSFYYKP
ncbi:MAG: hypothetical protein ACFNS5_04925 [Prevotella melaninogenica]